LLVQSQTFVEIWTNFYWEDSWDEKEARAATEENAEPFIFPLAAITSECFAKIVAWMEHRNGMPEPMIQFNHENRFEASGPIPPQWKGPKTLGGFRTKNYWKEREIAN
jgi:hypothetical protein